MNLEFNINLTCIIHKFQGKYTHKKYPLHIVHREFRRTLNLLRIKSTDNVRVWHVTTAKRLFKDLSDIKW